MRRPLVAFGLLALTVVGCHPSPPRRAPFRLEARGIPLAVHSTDRPGPAFLVLHANERTAVEVGLEAIRVRGGRLVAVEGQGRRLVTFEVEGERWRFDPNRIFIEVGAEATLVESNGSAPPAVVAEVRGLAEAILAAYGIDQGEPILALHNNSEGSIPRRAICRRASLRPMLLRSTCLRRPIRTISF